MQEREEVLIYKTPKLNPESEQMNSPLVLGSDTQIAFYCSFFGKDAGVHQWLSCGFLDSSWQQILLFCTFPVLQLLSAPSSGETWILSSLCGFCISWDELKHCYILRMTCQSLLERYAGFSHQQIEDDDSSSNNNMKISVSKRESPTQNARGAKVKAWYGVPIPEP